MRAFRIGVPAVAALGLCIAAISSPAEPGYQTGKHSDCLYAAPGHSLCAGLQRDNATGPNVRSLRGWTRLARNDASRGNDRGATLVKHAPTGFVAGVDTHGWKNLVFGVALTNESLGESLGESFGADTFVNAGRPQVGGYAIGPYLSYRATPVFGLDAMVGYSSLGIEPAPRDEARFAGGARGVPDSERWFGALNVHADYTFGHWLLSGQAAVLFASEALGAIEPSAAPAGLQPSGGTLDMGQLKLGADVAYATGRWEPFASLFYEHDFEREETGLQRGQMQPLSEDDNLRFGLGVRYSNRNGLSASFEYNVLFGRDDLDNHTFGLLGRYSF